jgi:cytochrome c oxidase subunit 3
MATRVTSTRPSTAKKAGGGPKVPGPNGKGPGGNGHGGEHDSRRKFSASRYRLTTWAVLAAVLMMFAALSSAYIVLSAGNQWRHITMPRMFYLSTVVILGSSFCFEFAKRYLRQGRPWGYLRWLGWTLLLGAGFLVTQLLGWRELAAQRVYFSDNPQSSFFYLFTAVHGVHLVGGIIALLYLLGRSRRLPIQTIDPPIGVYASMIAIYWHTMDVVWLWLFSLLFFLS